MATRKPMVGGNWKMNLHRDEVVALTTSLVKPLAKVDAEVVICPAFPYLAETSAILKAHNSKIILGAQDFYHQPNGAFTGEVSLSMLRDVGVRAVLAGHSERRHVIGEDDELINRKVRAGLDAGMTVILCVGEKLEERQAGLTDAVNLRQTRQGLAGVAADPMANVVIAYEPVWAIGTGRNATPEDAQSAHHVIRRCLAELYNPDIAEATRIIYGGSVKASNAHELFAQLDIDGGLIGGASLQADEFTAIVEAAA